MQEKIYLQKNNTQSAIKKSKGGMIKCALRK